MEKAFEKSSLRPNNRLPIAKELGETSLMYKVHPTLSETDIRDITQRIIPILNQAMKS